MKVIILLVGFILSVNAFGYSCPSYIESNAKALKALEFMKKFEGQFELGVCKVEITVCDSFENTTSNHPIAEVMLIDQYNREIYTSIAYPEVESWYFKTKTQQNKRMLNYNKWDRYYEEELGRTEHHQLEILTDWDNIDEIKSIHVGVYSTNNQLNQPNGNDSTWSICEQ